MVTFVQQTLQALFIELAGVGVTAGIIYLYWNYMTKNRHHHSQFLHTAGRVMRPAILLFMELLNDAKQHKTNVLLFLCPIRWLAKRGIIWSHQLYSAAIHCFLP